MAGKQQLRPTRSLLLLKKTNQSASESGVQASVQFIDEHQATSLQDGSKVGRKVEDTLRPSRLISKWKRYFSLHTSVQELKALSSDFHGVLRRSLGSNFWRFAGVNRDAVYFFVFFGDPYASDSDVGSLH